MGGGTSEPERICRGLSVGFELEELLRNGVHDVRVLLVGCEEIPDEGGQGGRGGVGLEDVPGGRDWHCGGQRGWWDEVAEWRAYIPYFFLIGNAAKPKVR